MTPLFALLATILASDPIPAAAPSTGTVSAKPNALSQEDQERIERLELRVEALAAELERNELGATIELGDGTFGLAPGASKIYGAGESQVSIGGYGESLLQFKPGRTDSFDSLRTVLYVGYKFSEQWLLNTEIEIEHGSTSDSSGTTSSGGSVSAEFAYLDYFYSEEHAARVGLVLVPMGLVNEIHEPNTYLAARRSATETRILPSTWREMGAGVVGDNGQWAYRAYVINGLNGSEFDDNGLRGGRQKGNRAAAEDLALVARVDYVGSPGLLVGGSIYTGDSGQEQAAGGADLGTSIFEAHVQYKQGGFIARGLYAMADIDDAEDFNNGVVGGGGSNPGLAEELNGGYLELGYDLLAGSESSHSVVPFVRYETLDTQASLPPSAPAGQGIDDDILTFGVAWHPNNNIVVKLDYEDWDTSDDQWNVQIGYVF